jgi:hypothetical protein
LPEPHSVFALHALPFGFAHVPFLVALHVVPDAHEPTVQHTPSVQKPLGHCDAEVQSEPSEPVVTQFAPSQ